MSDLNALLLLADTEPCRLLTPNGAQERMVKLVGAGDKTVSVFSGANGAGKTLLMVAILNNLIWGVQNHFFDYPLFRKWPYPKKIRIGTESANVKESGVIDDAIRRLWPRNRYEGFKDGYPFLKRFVTDTGWTIEKLSYEQATKEWESSTLGFIAFDEPPPKDKFTASISRLRAGGRVAIFMTPLMAAGWLIDELSVSPDMGIVYADIEENCKTHGKNGHLLHEDIDRMIQHMDPDEVEARAHGKPMHLSNVIYGRSFKREVHVVPDDLQPPEGSQFGLVVDPARGKPWAIGRYWVDPTGQIVFTDEYPLDDWLRCRETNLVLKDYSEIMHRMAAGQKVEFKIIDRHFANNRNDKGTTLRQDLEADFKWDFTNSYSMDNEVETGIQKVKDYLKGDHALGPMVRFKSRCRNIIRSLERWERLDTLVPNEKSPYKDHADLVRYVCAAGLKIYRPTVMPERRSGYAVGR